MKNLRYLAAGACLIVLAVLVLSACAKKEPAPATTTSATTTTAVKTTAATATTTTTTAVPAPATTSKTAAPSGPQGDLRVALSSMSGEILYPTQLNCTGRQDLLSPMFDRLFDLDGAKIAPGVIEKWQVSTDGLTWTYQIRKGIKFHDGSDLTAADVKFSLEDSIKDRFTT
ncbi:MAG: hypothetical protein HYX90_09000, partial [Chloroflexi bacterium]|nr:hypothetical protein [Chloroflexota bacterium]